MTQQPSRPQPGRMLTWHRQASYLILGLCCVSGLGWFALQTWMNWMPPQLKFWWVTHGVAGMAGLIILGAALPQHVIVTWRTKRNRWAGAACLLCAGSLAVSAAMLFYAPEIFRDTAYWLHSIAGFSLCLAFPWHLIRGKRAKPAKQPL